MNAVNMVTREIATDCVKRLDYYFCWYTVEGRKNKQVKWEQAQWPLGFPISSAIIIVITIFNNVT